MLFDGALEEMKFWQQNVAYLNKGLSWKREQRLTELIYSDASNRACAAFIQSEETVFHQNWSELESVKSSTWRELKAVSLAIESCVDAVKNQNISWFTDNQNVVSIVHKGSDKKMC